MLPLKNINVHVYVHVKYYHYDKKIITRLYGNGTEINRSYTRSKYQIEQEKLKFIPKIDVGFHNMNLRLKK
jgi:hypothetical protein